MHVKRFTAKDMTQAMRQVRQELGPEAVILATGSLPDGQVEVSAAVENSDSDVPQTTNPGSTETQAGGAAISALARRLDGLGDMLSRHLLVSEAANGFAARPEIAPLCHHLTEQEVDPALINHLLDGLAAPEGRGILPRLAIRLKKIFHQSGPAKINLGKPNVWALVGPTGVGKTTTLAKLAATFSLKHRLRVGMITVDTYRMAAAEQLKVYGRIMEVKTMVASTAEEFRQCLDKYKAMDIILVDTVGRAPSDLENLKELKAILEMAPDLICHLVLASPTRDKDMKGVVDGFAGFTPQSLIFTKLDETSTYGTILNQVVNTGLPVSYLTNGQKVPDDLQEASRDGLVRLLLPDRREIFSNLIKEPAWTKLKT